MTKDINSKAGHAISLSIHPQHCLSGPFTLSGFWNSVADVLNYCNYILKGNSSLYCRILEKEEILKISYFLNEE